MGRQHDGEIRVTGKAKDFVKKFFINVRDNDERTSFCFDFDSFYEEAAKMVSSDISEIVKLGWHGQEPFAYWERDNIGYLCFSFYGRITCFPEEIAIILSIVFANEEFGVCETIEDWGCYLDVYKDGKNVFSDHYDYDDDCDDAEIRANPTSISFETFYPKQEPKELTPEEKAEQEKQLKEFEKDLSCSDWPSNND